MDASRFDAFARSLTEAGTRRGLLGLLTGLPLLGGLAAFLTAEDESAAKNRRKKRKKPHKRAKRRRKHHTKKRHCKAHARSKVCNGKCGKVKNNCGKAINCGSCDCNPACGICQRCEGSPGVCVQDAPGTPCGETGQVCQDDGTCTCTDSSCPSCLECGGDGTCAGCTGCCDGDTCVASCPPGRVCCTAACVAGTCCDETTCLAPEAPDCIDHDCVCAANSNDPCASGETCCAAGCFDLDTDADHCGSCSEACTASEECCGGDCVDLDTDPDHCGSCGHDCGEGHLCTDGVCEVCVCPDTPGCFANITDAAEAESTVDGDTIRICAGTFPRAGLWVAVINAKDLTLIGAGPGITILTGGNVPTGHSPVVVQDCTATLRDLTVTGANGGVGILVQDATLTLGNVGVTGNVNSGAGGGIEIRNGKATLQAGTSITQNQALAGGGVAIDADSKLTLEVGSSVTGNTADTAADIQNEGTLVDNGGTIGECADVGAGCGCPDGVVCP